MSREAELLAAILADPDDDQARLVYGDVLLSRGDPRGELINVQLRLTELADADDDPAWPALARREQELLAAHRATWVTDLELYLDVRLRRGFIDQLRGSADRIVAAARAIRAAEPVTRIEVEDIGEHDDGLALLAHSEALRQVRALKLGAGSGIDWHDMDEHFSALVDAPGLASLVELDVQYTGVGDESAAALRDSPLATRMQRLDVSAGSVGDAGIAALLGGGLSALRWLGLAAMLDGAATIRAIIQQRGLATLRGLDLSGNHIGSDAAVALASALPELDELVLIDNELGAGGCAALAAAPALRGLRRLDVTGNQLRSADAAALADGFPALTWLGIDATDEVVAEIARARWPRLHTLELVGLGRGALRRLEAACWPGLRHLVVRGRDEAAAADALVEGAGLPTLTRLGLARTNLDDADVQRLAMGHWPALHTLDLSGNQRVGDAGALALARSDGLPAWLYRLDVGSTAVSPVGLAALRERFGAAAVTR